jgi:anti-anti-sigma regulatory factor
MTRETVQPGGEILVRLDGKFDAVAAWQVRARLGALPRTAKVVMDFSQVREFQDLGVAVMATSLAAREGPHVVVRGLCQHQHRMFRYFGVDLDALRAEETVPTPAPIAISRAVDSTS